MYNLDIFLDNYEVNNSCLTSEVTLFLQVRQYHQDWCEKEYALAHGTISGGGQVFRCE